MPTQAQRRETTRAMLLKQARMSFGTRGYDNVGIDELAAAANVTRGALYHHFESKEALFLAVFHELETELQHAIAKVVGEATGANPRDLLVNGCNAYIRTASRTTIARIVLVDAPSVLGWSVYRKIDETYLLPSVVDAVKSLRKTDDVKVTELLARTLFTAVCELALQVGNSKRYTLRQANVVVELFVEAISN